MRRIVTSVGPSIRALRCASTLKSPTTHRKRFKLRGFERWKIDQGVQHKEWLGRGGGNREHDRNSSPSRTRIDAPFFDGKPQIGTESGAITQDAFSAMFEAAPAEGIELDPGEQKKHRTKKNAYMKSHSIHGRGRPKFRRKDGRKYPQQSLYDTTEPGSFPRKRGPDGTFYSSNTEPQLPKLSNKEFDELSEGRMTPWEQEKRDELGPRWIQHLTDEEDQQYAWRMAYRRRELMNLLLYRHGEGWLAVMDELLAERRRKYEERGEMLRLRNEHQRRKQKENDELQKIVGKQRRAEHRRQMKALKPGAELSRPEFEAQRIAKRNELLREQYGDKWLEVIAEIQKKAAALKAERLVTGEPRRQQQKRLKREQQAKERKAQKEEKLRQIWAFDAARLPDTPERLAKLDDDTALMRNPSSKPGLSITRI